MITLKTLQYVTDQEVFDQVANHLLRQSKRSVRYILRGYDCVYRGTDGLSCAAGCLIADDEYLESFETHPWSYLIKNNYAPSDHAKLIRSLQAVHDGSHPVKWARHLKKVANEFSLEF